MTYVIREIRRQLIDFLMTLAQVLKKPITILMYKLASCLISLKFGSVHLKFRILLL